MKTQLEYLQNTYKYSGETTILAQGSDESGYFLLLDSTIFYPQGGGQPSDSGWVDVGQNRLAILKVRWLAEEVRHYVSRDSGEFVGKTGVAHIDQDLRQLHSKLHTSGHLISHIVEEKYSAWRALKGHHFPDQCYVEFTLQGVKQAEDICVEKLNQEIHQCISASIETTSKEVSGDELKTLCPDLTFKVPKDQPVRVIRIGTFPFSPCGGTHVSNTTELAGLEISKMKMKGNILKLYYHIVQAKG